MRAFAIGVMCLALAGCDSPNFRTSQFQFGSSQTLAASGNLRFVSERERVLPHSTARVVCSEPSPDYATEFDQSFTANFKSAVPQTPVQEGSITNNITETTHKGEGRSKGVLALRDGLYAACQAYANGLIGKDAYSIILSQYGLLLVSLMEDDTYQAQTAAAASKDRARARSSSAFAAVLVACINGHDPTRRDYYAAQYDENAVLTKRFCRSVLQKAGSGVRG
jgi:hypothetical protein